ncbi:MAG: hypothetical protein ABH871_01080 [Pseudomonadota bacterium]
MLPIIVGVGAVLGYVYKDEIQDYLNDMEKNDSSDDKCDDYDPHAILTGVSIPDECKNTTPSMFRNWF